MSPARLLARLPVRIRVTLAVTVAMAAVVAGLALFLILRLGHQLDRAIDTGLRTRAADVTALIRRDAGEGAADGSTPLAENEAGVAQVLSPAGAVVDAPPALRHRPLLSGAELARARARPLLVARTTVDGEAARLRAVPVRANGRLLVVVVGQQLEARDQAVEQLGRQLLVAGPVALLLASLIGYLAAAGALRPVVSMTRRARSIDAPDVGARLPVPPSRDEVAELGATLNAMLARLERAFAREQRFVADASHELRTPLSILRAELELALGTARTPADYRAAVVSSIEETDRIAQLAEDLLVLARVEQRGLPVRRAPVAVPALLATVRRRFAGRARERGIAIEVDAPEALTIAADAPRLEQALANVVDNALRHARSRVELFVAAGEEAVTITVSDDGTGFAADVLPRAFDRFARADDARTTGGAGLGLAIVRTIVRAHGGDATADNGPGGGARVEVRLPVRDPLIVLSPATGSVPLV